MTPCNTMRRALNAAFFPLFVGLILIPAATHTAKGQAFTEIATGLAQVVNSSVAWGDYDNDGDLDLLLTGVSPPFIRTSNVYRNDNGTFTDIAAGLTPVRVGSAAWGDYDNDSDLDILLTGDDEMGNLVNKIYRNNNGTFVDISAGLAGVVYSSVAWGDYDNDGDVDILLTGASGQGPISKVYSTNSDGTFTDMNAGLTGVLLGAAAWGDYDNDGDLDILLAGTEGDGLAPISKVYRNNGGGGTFTDINAGLAGVERSATWGDYDNDGDLDILLVGLSGDSAICKLYRNNGNDTFTENTSANLPAVEGSGEWGDYDNDGDLDILLAGEQGGPAISKVYSNNGNGTFSDINAGLVGSDAGSVAWGDYDNDGDLDILITGGVDANYWTTKMYRNNALTPNTAPTAPTGLTATVLSGYYVAFAWNAASDNQTPANGLSYNLRIGTTLNGVNTLSPMANLANGYRRISARGMQQILRDTVRLSPDKYYWSVQAVDAAFAGGPFSAADSFATSPFTNMNAGLPGLSYGSVEWGDYDNDGDLDLLAYGSLFAGGAQTTLYRNDAGTFTSTASGLPSGSNAKFVWGDYDNDGDLDLFVCANINGTDTTDVYRNNGNGTFTPMNVGFALMNSVSAAWGDFDNDGDLDIVVAGFEQGDPKTNLYRNNGGVFTNTNAGLTGLVDAAVAWGDYDNDGDLDLLTSGEDINGVLNTRVCRNNGNGTFTEVNGLFSNFGAGAAAWGDYDNDGDLDVLLAGYDATEAIATSLYRNNGNGTFTFINSALTPMREGSVAWGDYDNDGDLDVLGVGQSINSEIVTKVFQNSAGTFTEIEADYASVRDGNAAWGDFDNDGDLDIALTGQHLQNGFFTQLYRNNALTPNTAPTAPTGLTATVLSGNRIAFAWNAASDNQTPANGLSYNLRIGTTLNGVNKLSPMANLANGYRRIPARGMQQILRDTVSLPPGKYYWSVQAVDPVLAGGPFSATDSLQITYVTVSNGNWNNSATWYNGVVPTNPLPPGEAVHIVHNVDLNISLTNQSSLNIGAGVLFTVNSGVTFTNSGPIVNQGNFVVVSGATFRNMSDVTIGNVGTFTNSGTFTFEDGTLQVNGTFTTSAGTMRYVSANPQSVRGTTYGILEIGGANNKNLLANVVVNTQLILGCDIVLRLGDKTLTLQSGATVSRCTTGSLSHIRADEGGSLKRMNVGANVLFPVGTTNAYNPVTLTNTDSDNFTVSVKASFDVAPNNTTVCLTRQWTITEDTPGGNPTTVTLQFNATDERGVLFDPANPTMFIGRRPSGGPWLSTLATKGNLGVNGPYTVTASFSAFSPFTVTTDASALPVQLASFTGSRVASSSVRLNWRTISEINNYGFFVQRRAASEEQFVDVPNGFIAGHGTTNVPRDYSFVDNSALAIASEYRLRQVDLDGTEHFTEPINVGTVTSVKDVLPTEFALKQNFPNPFNPTTTIEYDIPFESDARLAIYNTLGQEVATLVNERLSAGRYQATWNATNTASGMYFYRLNAFDKSNKPIVLMRKLIVVK